MRHFWMIRLACGLALLAPGAARACITPVFRYALERWEPSPYHLLLFHRGPLRTNETALLEALQQMGAGQGPANLAVTPVDLAGPLDDATRQIWQAQTNPPLPRLVLRFPDTGPDAPSAWSGPLQKEKLRELVDSPLRREVARRIAAGQAAVWVLLECGDKAQDDAAAARVETELKKAARTIELPPDPALDQTNATQLKVEFSLLRVPNQDPAEALFVQMLLAVDPDLAEMKSPVAVPIFGRGRALCALPGPQITPPTLKEALAFLTGACSCEAKELNPGLDLLMAAKWDDAVQGRRLSDPPLPELIGLGSVTAPLKVTNAPPVVAAAAPTDAGQGRLARNLIYFSLGILVVVGLTTVVLSKSRKG